ncbi:MAG: two-component system NtrC family sensor kinase [Desulforhopalus sp.]|jgi:two-component system NtrC family sensor kinase
MSNSRRVIAFILAGNFIWIGLGIAFLYWVLESLLHVFFFGGSQFLDELIRPNNHEIWKRTLIGILLILYGVFAQQYFIQRKRVEKSIKESERKYRTIFEQALNPIFLFDDKGFIIDHNKAALTFFECSDEELLKKTFWDVTAQETPEEYTENVSIIGKYEIVELDYPLQDKTKTMLLNLVPFSTATKSSLYGIGHDITARKDMERILEHAHAELFQIFNTASVGMRVIDRNYNITKINKAFSIMADVAEEDAVNRKCYEIFSGPMCHTEGCPIDHVLRTKSNVEIYVDKQRLDGKTIPTILSATPFSGPDGEIIGIVESFRDISQLREAHEIIQLKKDKLQCILSHLQDGVCIINSDYTIEYQNRELEDYFGECTGKICYKVFRGSTSPCTPCPMLEAFAWDKNTSVEYTAAGRIYEQRYTKFTDIDGITKAMVFLRDVTIQKDNLATAMHSERLAAVGELAAGVAHEINNPINGIINYAQIISNKSEDGGQVKEIAERMIQESNRIARIVDGLLTFSRRQHKEKVLVAANDILSDSLTLTNSQMRKDNIIVTLVVSKNIPLVYAQSQEIQQVFINIINNARYALMEKYPGYHKDKQLKLTISHVQDDIISYVRISFVDHGVGIPENILDKVKSPFFSTKSEEKSTGLGLSISQKIVANHNGRLTINSSYVQFTRVDVDLPALPENVQLRNGV